MTSASAKAPLVSVVMPTFRRANQIGESIRSLLNGSFTDFELIVSDDGNGLDGTEQAVSNAAEGDIRVKYGRNALALRMPGNLNAAIRRAAGLYIAVCHDHDVYTPDFLKDMLAALTIHPSASFVHSAIQIIDAEGRRGRTYIGGWPMLTPGSKWLEVMLSTFSCPVCALTLVPRAAYDNHGLYDEAFGFISDVEMWMRLSCVGDVVYVDRPLILVRERELGHIEDKNALKNLWKLARIHRLYNKKRAGGRAKRAAGRVRLELQLVSQASKIVISRRLGKRAQ